MNVLDSSLIKSFLDNKKHYIKQNTHNNYYFAFLDYLDALEIEPRNFDLKDLNSENFSKYLNKRKKDGKENSTINAHLRVLKSFCGTNEVPFKVKLLPEERKTIEILNFEDIAKILSTLNLKEQCIWLCLYGFGLRARECAQLKAGDLDFREKTLLVRKGKGDKTLQVFPIYSSIVLQKLEQYIQKNSFSKNDYLFLSRFNNTSYMMVRAIVKKGEKILGRRITPHQLRHSHGTTLIEQGIDITLAKRNLRHTDIKMTERYVDLTAPMVKKALEKVDIPVQGKTISIHDTEQPNGRFLCIYCGAKMENGEMFCWNCGMQVFMLCPNPKIDCSGIIRMDKEKCPKCGFDVKKVKEKIKEKYGKKVMP